MTEVAPGEYLNFDANLPGVGGPMTFGFLDSKLNNIAWNNIFKIAQSKSDTRVFSSPSLVVTHNAEEVEISMKNKRTVFSESSYNSTTGGQSQFSNDRDFESETTLKLLSPRISPRQEIEIGGEKKIIAGSVYTEVELITSNLIFKKLRQFLIDPIFCAPVLTMPIITELKSLEPTYYFYF